MSPRPYSKNRFCCLGLVANVVGIVVIVTIERQNWILNFQFPFRSFPHSLSRSVLFLHRSMNLIVVSCGFTWILPRLFLAFIRFSFFSSFLSVKEITYLSIDFYLTLNNVISNAVSSVLKIDRPIETMDEFSWASFYQKEKKRASEWKHAICLHYTNVCSTFHSGNDFTFWVNRSLTR